MSYLKKTSLVDAAGMTMSIVCLLHCLAIPAALVIYAAAGAHVPWKEDETHQVFAVIVFFISLTAIVQGLRGHGQRSPAMLILLGTAGICVAAFDHNEAWGRGLSTILTMLSSVILVTGHLMNRKCPRACTEHGSLDESSSS